MKTAAPRRILHREKPDGRTVEFSTDHIDAMYDEAEKLIPFDSPNTTNNAGWLKRCVEKGTLEQVTLSIDGKPVGLITYAVTGELFNELLISTASITDHSFDYIPLLTTFAKRLAKAEGCKYVRFHTVRKGLVKKALDQGFFVAEIVLRLKMDEPTNQPTT